MSELAHLESTRPPARPRAARPKDTVAALKAHRHLRGPLVFGTMEGMLKVHGAAAPVVAGVPRAGLRMVQWHSLRHSFASHLVMRGVAPKAVPELLGHSTIQMTMRYAHLAPQVTRHAVNLLDRPVIPAAAKPR